MLRKAILLLFGLMVAMAACSARPSAWTDSDAEQQLLDLQQTSAGRLGVYVLDSETGRHLALRADERFGMNSTFKLLLAAVVLRAMEEGEFAADMTLPFSADDLVPHAPVIQARLDNGIQSMHMTELAKAAQLTSDNTAANLLIRQLGGPEGVTARWRALGDQVSRLDRYETEMNFVPAGEVRDTTTPRAMAETVARLFVGDVLGDGAREDLKGWMLATETGLKRLRAGFPPGWQIGDKTGSGFSEGMPNKTHDVAVIWREGRKPVVIAAYYEADAHYPQGVRDEDEAVLAGVGRIVQQWLQQP